MSDPNRTKFRTARRAAVAGMWDLLVRAERALPQNELRSEVALFLLHVDPGQRFRDATSGYHGGTFGYARRQPGENTTYRDVSYAASFARAKALRDR